MTQIVGNEKNTLSQIMYFWNHTKSWDLILKSDILPYVVKCFLNRLYISQERIIFRLSEMATKTLADEYFLLRTNAIQRRRFQNEQVGDWEIDSRTVGFMFSVYLVVQIFLIVIFMFSCMGMFDIVMMMMIHMQFFWRETISKIKDWILEMENLVLLQVTLVNQKL